jgi:hypothetical protein
MICAFDECSKSFEPHRHNQKYCCSECCKEATNKKIRTKYSETKKRLQGEKRICINKNCGTLLSRYTEDNVCNKCIAKEKSDQLNKIRNIFK